MGRSGLARLWHRATFRRLAAALLTAAVITTVAGLGALYAPDNVVSDALFQRGADPSGDIMVLGIDSASLDAFGPVPWTRDIMAMVVENLTADPDNLPAVIGIDVAYGGYSQYPADDDWLVEACEGARQAGCTVVVAMYGETGMVAQEYEDGSFSWHEGIVGTAEPFDELAAVTEQGHINAVYDPDGVLRHYVSQIYTQPRWISAVHPTPAFGVTIARAYAGHHGLELAQPKTTRVSTWGDGFYIHYTARPGYYDEGLSVLDAFDGAVPGDMAGKIVLIGPYDAATQDFVTAAIDHSAKMFGIEVQANAIDMLLRGDFKREASQPLQLALLFLFCLAAFLLLWDRRVLPATAIWLALSGGGLAASYLLYHRAGWVTHALWLPLAATVIYIATVAINYVRVALERRRVTATFKRYVAPEIVAEILREGSESLGLGGKLRDIAVLFVDIRGFTPMSEVLEPPQVVEVLNRYLTLTSSCVTQNGGTLDKFIGDATMAFWGAPLPQEDHIFKAVKAALDMVAGSRALSAELEARFGRTVSFGIGVHCGPAVVGNIGADMRMDYTAIGDTVNTAARLESNAKPGKILISRAVMEALADRITTTGLGAIPLKGKAEGFEVWEVDGLAGEAEA